MQKIIFIASNTQLPRVIRRINEFVDKNYEVEVYCFERTGSGNKHDIINAPVIQMGVVNRSPKSYLSRIPIQYKSIRKVVKKFSKEDVVFYLFGIDNALLFPYRNNIPFIFEESDLRHTDVKYKIGIRFFEYFVKKIIKKSLLTVFTSEGFCKYHFGNNKPSNIAFITNRLTPQIKELEVKQRRSFDINNLRFGFVGAPRYKAIYNFVSVVCKNYPQHEVHFWGEPVKPYMEPLKQFPNCYFHGAFSNPKDLPDIYQNIDLVLATYDTDIENVRYAEPNKLYEAIYFEAPIIVASDTFLAEKVNRLGVGFDLNAYNDNEIISFVDDIKRERIFEIQENMKKISKDSLLSYNDDFFEQLSQILKKK